MPRPTNPAAPSCPDCGHPHMHSNGDRWRCPSCRKRIAKSGKPRGGYRHGVEGGTSSTERARASRKRTGKTGNEARDRRRLEGEHEAE